MPVAPSFTTYKLLTEEPFLKNGKLYITVEHPRTHNSRDVRWYSDAEFDKTYPQAAKQASAAQYGGLKHARGFDEGYILCVRGNRNEDEPWLIASNARWAMGIRWYFVPTEPIPTDLPNHFRLIKLTWEEASEDDKHMKPDDQLKKIVDSRYKKI